MIEKLKELWRIRSQIDWPSPRLLVVSMVAVLIVSAIISAYLIGLDTLFIYLRNLILFK